MLRMLSKWTWTCIAALPLAPQPARAERPQFEEDLQVLSSATSSPPAIDDATADKTLAIEVDLDTVLRVATWRNPDIQEARERIRAAGERVRAASRLPDMELKQETWGVPLRSPFAFGESQTVMAGVRQTFPARGARKARGRAAGAEQDIAMAVARARELDVVSRVRKAYFEYYRADLEYRLHLEQVTLSSQMVDLARSNYQVGRGSQQDVLRMVVDLSSLHSDLATIDQERRSVKALLNTLMARSPDAPIGPVSEIDPPIVEIDGEAARAALEEGLPELKQARHATEKSDALLEAARVAGRRPTLMVGADYWYMPTFETKHAYGTMVSISLPWLNPVHREEVKEASHLAAADRFALESTRNTARYQLEDALARYQAAREAFAVIDRDLLRQARQSFEAAQSSFRAGGEGAIGLLDSLRSYFRVRHERVRAVARLGGSLADIERAVGGSLVRPVESAELAEVRP